MELSKIDQALYQHTGGIVLGFHGCDETVGKKILNSQTEHLKASTNDYDWLGEGIYFWLNDPVRAYEWAIETEKRGKIKRPYVIGAVIELGNCLNLSERSAIRALRRSYTELRLSFEFRGEKINEKVVNSADDAGGFKLFRRLDCLVINNLIESAKADGQVFDTVYGYFQEGKDAYPGAGIREKSHIQICVRNTDCIKGYFLPRAISADMDSVVGAL